MSNEPSYRRVLGTGLVGSAGIMGLHHTAYRCRNSEETRKFYEDFLGLPLVDALMMEQTKTADALNFLHTFYQLDDGSCIAFFELANCEEIGRPFEFKEQSDFDLHIAFQVPTYEKLQAMFEKGKELGIETRGISDHSMVHSIYFRDPNGYVIELTCPMKDAVEVFSEAKKTAHSTLATFVQKYSPKSKL